MSFAKGLLSLPYGSNSDDTHTFGHARINFHLRPVRDYPKEWPTVLDKELMVLNLKDLSLEEASTYAAREVGLEYGLQKLTFAHLDPPQRCQVNSLDLLASLDAGRQLDTRIDGHFTEIIRASRCNKELDFTNLEIRVFLEDSRP